MRKWKVFVSLLLVLIFISSSVLASAYSIKYIKIRLGGKTVTVRQVPVVVDGKTIYTKDPTFVMNSRTYVPIRFIADHYGGKVGWDDATRTATLKVDGKEIKLTIDSKTVYVNGKKHVVEERLAPKLVTFDYGTSKARGRTMVALRLIADILGYKIGYDEANGIPSITKPKQNNSNTGGNQNNQGNDETKIINTVKDIKKETVNGKDAIVVYKTNKVEINQFKLGSQDVKLVFDLKNSSIVGGGYYVYDISFGPIENVRASQFDKDVVRVVLDIKKGVSNPEVEVIDNKDKLIIIPKGVEPETPKKPSIIISIDAGHGGHDPGAVQNGVNEKDITLEVAKKLDSALKKEGYDTVMTRDKDVYVELKERADIANRNNSDIFISLHCNSFSSESAHGIEVLYNPNRSGSKQLAQLVLDELVKATGARNRGIKERPELAVLKHTTMPAILVEMGFISNKAEAQKLQTASYQNKIVEAIVKGVEKYIDTYN